MAFPLPDRDFLASQIRWARGRGVPLQEAEDLVFDAYHRAVEAFDPERGTFEAYMHTIVRNRCAYWWRRRSVVQRAHTELRLAARRPPAEPAEVAARRQAAILEALDGDERRIFAAWALQKHLGKGVTTSQEVARSLGMSPAAYDNAKRRLKHRLHRLLEEFDWTVADVLHGGGDVEAIG